MDSVMTEQGNALFAGLWICGLFAASGIYRKAKGKPVIFFTVPNASFIQRTASGSCDDTWWRSLGGAANCLVVAISAQRLIIRPFTPFNLMFLPEIYGLEYEIPLENIVTVAPHRSFFRSGLRVNFRDGEGGSHQVSLFLRNPEEFQKQIPERCRTA